MIRVAYFLTMLWVATRLGSCAVADPPFEPSVPETIRVDSAELVEPTSNAMDRWTRATGVEWRIVEGTADLFVHAVDLEDGASGRYYSSGEIRIEETLSDPESTIVHELGHALTPALVMSAGQAAHLDGPGIMHADGGTCITEADLVLVCAEVVCDRFVPEC